ncbi:ACT domain-containing protein [Anaerocolumna sp. MB42-C2]|uniref:ACT domain-containing protein n=1 Tax=Anaerocolumna sp. MB42-C2 TaxID=3070997 RepID=UPI0027E0CC8E|nr:ACT domain-containing protein [Anaerocolumna sp. MB42-C2]WMJ90587.1 ACT domain-containing protein [Anaerocolumna sp. MB42-C2]
MVIKVLSPVFSVCKIPDLSMVNMRDDYVFIGKTEEELSLVCDTNYIPSNYTDREDNWRVFKIQGQLDFSLIGILSKITKILADNKIGVFAVSTYNTDYILVKEENLSLATKSLAEAGYGIV